MAHRLQLALLLSILSLAAGVVLPSCDRGPSATTSATAPRGEPDAVYTVRGLVEALPVAGDRLSEFIVKHEPVDTFLNPNGTYGMDTMSMPMPVGADADLSTIAVGDIVELDLAVWTTPGQRGYEARRINKLPADTTLRFGKAIPRPPTPSP